jgi:hypothetical protein
MSLSSSLALLHQSNILYAPLNQHYRKSEKQVLNHGQKRDSQTYFKREKLYQPLKFKLNLIKKSPTPKSIITNPN